MLTKEQNAIEDADAFFLEVMALTFNYIIYLFFNKLFQSNKTWRELYKVKQTMN